MTLKNIPPKENIMDYEDDKAMNELVWKFLESCHKTVLKSNMIRARMRKLRDKLNKGMINDRDI